MITRLTLIFASTWSIAAAADCAARLGNESIHIYPARAEITDDTSRPFLAWIADHLERYRHLAENGTSDAARIYKAISPQIGELIARGQALQLRPTLNQDQIFTLAYGFVNVVDFAAYFADRVGYHADGFNLMRGFNHHQYEERRREFETRFGIDPLLTILPAHYARSRTQNWTHPEKDLKYTRYLIAGLYDEKPNEQHYFFQYKFVPSVRELSMRELFQDRERGIAYYGVTQKPFVIADGHHLNAWLFMDHDLFHAFVMKFCDLKLFKQLGVTTVAAARDVKAINNALLQRRLEEWTELKRHDRALGAAIEVLFFALLHEQARTYPIGVRDDLSTRPTFYRDGITRALRTGRLGSRAMSLMKDREQDLLARAMDWLNVRAQADVAEFYRSFPRRLPSARL